VSWLQIELRATPASLPHIEEVLFSCGAVSVSLVSDADEPVLEPAPGETPLWSSVRMQALFDLDADVAALRRALAEHRLLDSELAVDFVHPQDWQQAARGHAVDEVFAGRLRVLPKEAAAQADTSMVYLRLDPGLAFGSGSHPTTRMCLCWLARQVKAGQKVLDFGCGSGILAIAAALLGAQVVAVDYDAQAVMATRENAAYNGIDDTALEVLSLEEWQSGNFEDCFDIVVANILASPLQELAAEFEQVLVDGGALVLSGILQDQAESVMSSYAATEFDPPEIEAGWACLAGIRRGR
jgi:ribosomal protein L11 methyltransferase